MRWVADTGPLAFKFVAVPRMWENNLSPYLEAYWSAERQDAERELEGYFVERSGGSTTGDRL